MRKLFLLLVFMLAGVFSAMGGEYIVYQPTAPIVISYSGSQPTIPAENFVSLSDGDEIVLRITNIGSKSGDNAPKYKLITDSWETPTVAETVITSTDGTISYTVETGVAAKIKSSGLTISGQNYSLLDVVVVTASALSDTWTVVSVYNGSTVCDGSGQHTNINNRTYSDVREGDVLSIDYSSASEGQIFLQYGWSGTYHDHGGLDGSGTVEITIDSDLLSALRSSDGAQVYGKL